MSTGESNREAPRFAERPTELLVPDAYLFAGVLLLLTLGLAVAGWGWPALVTAGLAVFVLAFFRNPNRTIPGDERTVVSPADGRVIEVSEDEDPAGQKRLRIGIFLSVFNVHVNRAPVAGRVRAVERSGNAFLAAFNPEARNRNVQSAMQLETERGERVDVVQITGLIARRIVCHPVVGDWLDRGTRYGLIRFGSRTDVLLPPGSEACVEAGERVRGGSSILGTLP